MQSRSLVLLALLLSAGSTVLGQSITHEVSSTPAEVNVQGKAEVLGEVRLVKSDPGVLLTSQASSISLQYQGVPIVNRFDGQKGVNLVTGVISDIGGINITLTGGYVHAGVSANVRNVSLGNTTNGVLTLSLPAGLSLSQSDQILFNGVNVDLTGKPAYTDILCSLQSTPSNANTFKNVSTVRVGWIVNKNPLISNTSPLPDGFTGLGYNLTFAATGGTPPYKWSVVEGSLPPNLILNPETGVLGGGLAAAGVFNFTLKVNDSLNRSSQKAFTLYLQNIAVTGGGTDFGLVAIGTSLTRSLVVKNEGGKSATVSLANTGSAAFTLPSEPFVLDPGGSRPVDVTFTPLDTNQGIFFRALIAVSIPGLTRRVEMIGKGVVAPVPVFTVLPRSGATLGNTRVKIQGQGLTLESKVALGGVALSNTTWVNDQLLLGSTGPHAEGAVEVSVTQSDGTTIRTSNAFSYRQFPKVVAGPGAWRIPFVVDSSEFRTNLGINNLSEEAAAASISLVDTNGLLIAKKLATIPANGLTQINNIARFLEGGSGVTGREGTLIVESSQAIRPWTSQIDNTTSDPSLELALNQGAPRILIPSIVASERFTSSLVIVNTSSEDGQFNIVARDSNGGVLVSKANVPVSGNGYLFFEGLYAPGGPGESRFGPVEIESLGGIHLIAAANIRSTLGTGGYFQGVSTDSAATQVSLPYVVDTAEFRTNLGINNPGEKTTNVTVYFRDKDGFTQGSMTQTVPPHGLTQLNDVVRLLSGSSGVANQEGWLSMEADQPIVGWTSQIDNASQDPSLVIGKSAGASRLLVPSVVNLGNFKSTLVVVSPNAAPVSVELTARDSDGNLQGSQVVAIPAFGLLSFSDILDTLGVAGSFGSLEIASTNGRPLLAVSRVSSAERTGGYFEGQVIGP
jgi:hypothetical protein